MPYAQKNYLEKQGINGKYRISQIGCFLTSFSNLMERFGKGSNPLELNALFRDRGIYRDTDDGVRDDLSWDAIQRLNGNIVVTRTGTGRPPHSNAIVKFTNLNTTWKTHFSLVADANKGLIVDSWDGQVKSWNAYGGPKSWATYEDRTPKPAPAPVPVTPAPAPAPVAPQPDVVRVKAMKGWGISYLLKAAGYNKEQYGDPTEWVRFSHLNGAPAGQNIRIEAGKVYSVYRNPLPPQPVATPAPVEVPAPAPSPTPAPVEIPAPPVEPAVPAEAVEVKVSVGASTDFKATATDLKKVYVTTRDVTVYDIAEVHKERKLKSGVRVDGAQVFQEDGVQYVRTQKSVDAGYWYGIPLDALTEYSDPATNYVGPLKTPDTDLFDLSVAKEARIALHNLSPREKLVDLLAKLFGFVTKIKLKVTK